MTDISRLEATLNHGSVASWSSYPSRQNHRFNSAQGGLLFLGNEATEFNWYDHLSPSDRTRLEKFYANLPLNESASIEYRLNRSQDLPPLLVREVAQKLAIEGQSTRLEGVLISLEETDLLLARCLSIESEEREKLGQELHDDVCQQLAALNFFANSLSSKLQQKNLADELAASKEIADQIKITIEKVRAISHGLNPQANTKTILSSAMNQLKEQVELLYGIRCNLHLDEGHPLDDTNTVLNLYRIAQEAIQNSLKHGQATEVWIRLRQEQQTWSFSIHDNGKGKTSEFTTGVGMGLHNMRSRAEHVGASFLVQDNPDKGIGIFCTIGN